MSDVRVFDEFESCPFCGDLRDPAFTLHVMSGKAKGKDHRKMCRQILSWEVIDGVETAGVIGLSEFLKSKPVVLSETCNVCGDHLVEFKEPGVIFCFNCKKELPEDSNRKGEPRAECHNTTESQPSSRFGTGFYYQVLSWRVKDGMIEAKVAAIPLHLMQHSPAFLRNLCPFCDNHLLMFDDNVLCVWCPTYHLLPSNQVRLGYRLHSSNSGIAIEGRVRDTARKILEGESRSGP